MTSTPFRDLLHAANLRHGTEGFTSPPKEGVLRIFSPLKIRRLRPGLNPRTWVLKSSTKPLMNNVNKIQTYLEAQVTKKFDAYSHCTDEWQLVFIRPLKAAGRSNGTLGDTLTSRSYWGCFTLEGSSKKIIKLNLNKDTCTELTVLCGRAGEWGILIYRHMLSSRFAVTRSRKSKPCDWCWWKW